MWAGGRQGGGGGGGGGWEVTEKDWERQRREEKEMEDTRDKLRGQKCLCVCVCVCVCACLCERMSKAVSKQVRMLVCETDWETCLHQCWGQQDFGRSSAFVGGGEERRTRESEGWKRRWRRRRRRRRWKKRAFGRGTGARPRGDGRVVSSLIGCGLWWRLTLRARCL